MSRNAEEGFKLYKELYDRGIELVFLKEPHINTSSYRQAMGVALPSVQTGDEATQSLVESVLDAVQRFYACQGGTGLSKGI